VVSKEIELKSDFKYERVAIFHVTVIGKETFPIVHLMGTMVTPRILVNSSRTGLAKPTTIEG
jgi:hypothetical protein